MYLRTHIEVPTFEHLYIYIYLHMYLNRCIVHNSQIASIFTNVRLSKICCLNWTILFVISLWNGAVQPKAHAPRRIGIWNIYMIHTMHLKNAYIICFVCAAVSSAIVYWFLAVGRAAFGFCCQICIHCIICLPSLERLFKRASATGIAFTSSYYSQQQLFAFRV